MEMTLDIAALLSAVLRPAVVLVFLLVYREKLIEVVAEFAGNISKIGIAGISIELAQAKSFSPELVAMIGGMDLRQEATALDVHQLLAPMDLPPDPPYMKIGDSLFTELISKLLAPDTADYAEVNLGTGWEWLTSRLYIMSIIYDRMKGVRAFVYYETAGDVRKRFVGWAKPEKIRWALSRRYPWLEKAYTDAKSNLLKDTNILVLSNRGQLGYSYSPYSGEASISLLREFLKEIQAPPQPFPIPKPEESNEWYQIGQDPDTYEHAQWLDSQLLEDLMGEDLHIDSLRQSELKAKKHIEQLSEILSQPGEFVALTNDDGRFKGLLNRNVILEQTAQQVVRKAGA